MPSPSEALAPEEADYYRRAIRRLQEHDVPFLVGGAYAFARYTGIVRHTKDFDVFLRRRDLERAFAALDEPGYRTEVTAPHWLAKAYCGEYFVDLIFASGNGVSEVDDGWFERATEGEALGLPVMLCAPEDILWPKAYIQERERYDGADVAHLILKADLDWEVLLRHFDGHWRVLMGHLVTFGFIYPSERDRIPGWVMEELTGRLLSEVEAPAGGRRVCMGTLLSRSQYLRDVEEGFEDGRLLAGSRMSEADIEGWTAQIGGEDLPENGTPRGEG